MKIPQGGSPIPKSSHLKPAAATANLKWQRAANAWLENSSGMIQSLTTGARMSGQATRKLHEATEAFMNDFKGARETMIRIAQIQAKMSQCMDECLAEVRALFPSPVHQPLHPTNDYDNPPNQSHEDLPQMVRDATGTR